MGNWRYNTTYRSYFTQFITGRGPPCRDRPQLLSLRQSLLCPSLLLCQNPLSLLSLLRITLFASLADLADRATCFLKGIDRGQGNPTYIIPYDPCREYLPTFTIYNFKPNVCNEIFLTWSIWTWCAFVILIIFWGTYPQLYLHLPLWNWVEEHLQ